MPQIVRGALDIGSGQHKLLIGLVDTASRRIVQKLRTEQAQVRLGQALLQNSEGALDSAVLARSRSVLTSFREIGEEAGVSEWCGVCTAVFRRANNGDAYLDSANAGWISTSRSSRSSSRARLASSRPRPASTMHPILHASSHGTLAAVLPIELQRR